MAPLVLVWDPLVYLDWEYAIQASLLGARGVELIVAGSRQEGDAAEEGFIRYHEECAEVALELLEASGVIAPTLEGAVR